MKWDTKKVYKFFYKLFGWIFDQFPLWLKLVIVLGLSFAIFWFYGYLALLKVFAIVLWIVISVMILILIINKLRHGTEGPILKMITRVINRGLLREMEELSEEMESRNPPEHTEKPAETPARK